MAEKVLLAHLHNVLQDSFGEIEDSGRYLRKASLQFPLHTEAMLDELKTLKRHVEYMIATLETLENEK